MVKFIRHKLHRCRHRCNRKTSEEFSECLLCDLKPGCKARIKCLKTGDSIRQRLLALGLMPDVQVDVVRKAPFGDPIELRIQDSSLTLSKSEAAEIEVEPLE